MINKSFYNLRPEIPLTPSSSMSLIREERLTFSSGGGTELTFFCGLTIEVSALDDLMVL